MLTTVVVRVLHGREEAISNGLSDIENRMNDVKKRYGFYPQDKWNSNMNLKQYFEGKMNKDIYLICEKDTFALVFF